MPLTGLRFTCTSKTLMKIETRGRGVSPRSSSGGGTADVICEIIPSAGEITRPSPTGVTRRGSRKKYAHQAVARAPIQPSGVEIQNRISVTSANSAMNG